VEFYVGLMAEENYYGNSIFPSLLAAMVGAEAFRGVFGNALLSPNVYNETTFTAFGLQTIKETTLQTLVTRNLSKVSPGDIISFDLVK